MDLMTWILIGAGVLFLLLLISFKRQADACDREMREELEKRYGTRQNREISRDYLKGLADAQQAPGVDDITWNDLDMDRVFTQADHTTSFPGQEYLYQLLRNPDLTGERTARLQKGAAWFADRREEVLAIRIILNELDKEEEIPFSTRFSMLCEAALDKPGKYIRAGIYALISLILTPIIPAIGVIGLFICLVRNALIHTRTGQQYEKHFSALQDILRMMYVGRLLQKSGHVLPEPLTQELEESLNALSKFEKNGKLLTGTYLGSNGVTGVLSSYINLFFLRDLAAYCYLQKGLREQEDAVAIRKLAGVIGELDVIISLNSYRMSLPGTCFPEYVSDKPSGLNHSAAPVSVAQDKPSGLNHPASVALENPSCNVWDAAGLYHPLLLNPVKNDLSLEGNLLITGSNASGKSTFLKTVAINAIFAESLGFACADRLKMTRVRIMSSMALRDDIVQGESYFLAEIRSLKRIMDASLEPAPILCVIDEVLRGTNTIERIAASTEILKLLVKPHITALAATHDQELTSLLADCYKNAHFEEVIGEHDIEFPYLMKEGPATGRNAIALLGIMGFDPEAVARARQHAEKAETGIQKPVSRSR